MTGPTRRLLTFAQVADRWGCSKRTVQRKAERGEIETVNLGERLPRIDEGVAERYVTARIRPAKVGGAP